MARPMRELKGGETRSRDSPRSADRFRYCVRLSTPPARSYSALFRQENQPVYGRGKNRRRWKVYTDDTGRFLTGRVETSTDRGVSLEARTRSCVFLSRIEPSLFGHCRCASITTSATWVQRSEGRFVRSPRDRGIKAQRGCGSSGLSKG